jgi:CheY-like chemotaxis protein
MALFTKKKVPAQKVLIVEDDSLLLKVLSERFIKDTFQVATVENGLEVMDAVKKFQPDIIMLDLIIPGIDGFAVLKELKANTQTRHIPVAVLSNLEEVGDVKSVKALGAEEYFIKANTEMKQIVDYAKKRLRI